MKRYTDKGGKGGKLIVLCFWLVLFLILFSQRDKLTVERIVGYSPENMVLACAVILLLYGVKGCTMLINGYILYIAAGIMFPTALALVINLLGSVIMITIPYILGRRGGVAMLNKLMTKYQKLEALRDKPKENPRQTAFLLRILGVLPCEIVSLFLGACELDFWKYLTGSLMGLIPSLISTTIMGVYASTPGSPQFIIAAVIWAVGAGSGLVLSYVEKKKKRGV